MFKRAILIVAAVIGCGAVSVASAHAQSQGAQCIKLEQKVAQCSAKKSGKLSRQAAQQCKSRKRQYSNSCSEQPVCGQPAFSCPEGKICAQVMPQPITYASVSELKSDGASFLYYGECLERVY